MHMELGKIWGSTVMVRMTQDGVTRNTMNIGITCFSVGN